MVRSKMSSFFNSTIDPSGLIVRAAISLILTSLPRDFAKQQVDLALRLSAAVGENLDAEVVVEDQVAVGIVVNPDFPKETFSVGFFLHRGVFQRQVGWIDGLPVVAGGLVGLQKRQKDTVIAQSGGNTGDEFSLKLTFRKLFDSWLKYREMWKTAEGAQAVGAGF